MKCPDCEGGKQYGIACGGGGCRAGAITCSRCRGSSIVPDECADWIVRGKAHRARRLDRGLGQMACANRYGLSVVDFSDMERGRVDPSPLEAAEKEQS